MDLKIYKKTRIQGVYQHIKNKNYAIDISKPYKTSISRLNGEKIYDKELAKDIAANPTKYLNSTFTKELKDELKAQNKDDMREFDIFWNKYINWCIYSERITYNTQLRKNKTYKKYLKDKIDKSISKLSKEFWSNFIVDLDTTNKQKNEVLKQIKAFYNWCVNEEKIIKNNVVFTIKKIPTKRSEMKFWSPDETKQFLNAIERDLDSKDRLIKRKSQLIYALANITLASGNRIGETRALKFNSFDYKEKKVVIDHSINYNRKDESFITAPKTKSSNRENAVTSRLLEVVHNYKKFLEEEYDIIISDEQLIFFNYSTKKPFSDTTLRKHFNYYCKKANVKEIRMYDMRHTFATNLIAENIPIFYVQKSLGHSNYSTTVKNYVHAREDLKITTAEVADKLLHL